MAGDITDFRNSHNFNSPTASTQGNGEDWRQYIPEPDTSNNDWGGYRPETYEYTDWSGNKQRAPYVPNAPRPDAFNNVPGVENDPSDALGLWNMSRYYDSGAIRAPQWYIHGGVDSYGDSSAYPYYERESYKNTYGAGRNPFAEAHPNWKWTEGDLSSTRPGWDSQGNVVGGWNADGSTRPYVPGPNDRYQGGGPPPPKVRGNGWGGQDWWNTGSGGGSGGGSPRGGGAPAGAQMYGGMGGGGGGGGGGMASRSSMGASRSTGGGTMMAYSPNGQPYSEARKAPPTTATQATQPPMSDDELRALALQQRAQIAQESRNSQAYKDRIAAGAKARPNMRSLTTDAEYEALQNDPNFRFQKDFLVGAGGPNGDVQSAAITQYMARDTDASGKTTLRWKNPQEMARYKYWDGTKYVTPTLDERLGMFGKGQVGYDMSRADAEAIMNRYNQQFGGSAQPAPAGNAPQLSQNAPRSPRPAATNPMTGGQSVANLGAPGYNNGNPYYNKWGNLRAPFRNAMAQGTNWDLGGPNGAALFGAGQSYNYFPQQSASPMGYSMGAPQSLPSQFGGIDPLTAMMAFGGF